MRKATGSLVSMYLIFVPRHFSHLRTEFVSYFFVLGRVLRHFCNVLLYTSFVLKQKIAEMS